MPGSSNHGNCLCGAVAFEISADISDVIVCHCSICRRLTGGSGIAVTIVDKDEFRWKRGEDLIATWRKPNADWQSWFCRRCGSTLPGENDEQRMFVPANLIPDAGQRLKVTHHIWVDSKAAWDRIGGSGKQHPQAFAGA